MAHAPLSFGTGGISAMIAPTEVYGHYEKTNRRLFPVGKDFNKR